MFNEFDIHPRLLTALERRDISDPTDIQSTAIPIALAGRDLQIKAETGSGKTIAFVLPICSQLAAAKEQRKGTAALILAPTRELARQVYKQCEYFGKQIGLRAVLITGGQESKYQAALLRKDPDIVVATPGRILKQIETGAAELSAVKFLVLDEADRMLDMGFRDEVLAILSHTHESRQTILLSATLNHRGVSAIAREFLDNPEKVDLGGKDHQHKNIAQKLMLSDDRELKQKQAAWLLSKSGFDKALIFCNKRSEVDDLARWLSGKGFNTDQLHGEMRQDDRKRVLNAYSQGRFNVLVASDVAARGLDISGVDLVINFDVPYNGDEYVHRVGRTGRAGSKGTAITLVTSPEWNRMISIQRFVGTKFEQISIPGLDSRFKGPKKTKSSGKVASSGKRKRKNEAGARTKRKSTTGKSARRTAATAAGGGSSHKRKDQKSTPPADRSGMAPPRKTLKPD